MWVRKDLKLFSKKVYRNNILFCIITAVLQFVIKGMGTCIIFSLLGEFLPIALGLNGGIFNLLISKAKSIGLKFFIHGVKTDFNNPNEYLLQSVSEEAVSFLISTILILIVIGVVLSVVIHFLVIYPLNIGCKNFFYKNLYEKSSVTEVLKGFFKNYFSKSLIMLLKDIYIFLFGLLFIIPGIVKRYEYRMVPYLIAVNPQISSKEALSKSKKMMRGQKWRVFVLDLSFLGWDFLSILTIGIVGILYSRPYKYQTDAALYDILCREQANLNSLES